MHVYELECTRDYGSFTKGQRASSIVAFSDEATARAAGEKHRAASWKWTGRVLNLGDANELKLPPPKSQPQAEVAPTSTR